jgi:hypothetical protein
MYCTITGIGLPLPWAWMITPTGVGLHGPTVELEAFERLVADDPSVVAGMDLVRVAGRDLELLSVRGDDLQRAREPVADVVLLATVAADDRLHALRPPPSRLGHRLGHPRPGELHPGDDAVRELPRFVRLFEPLTNRPHRPTSSISGSPSSSRA